MNAGRDFTTLQDFIAGRLSDDEHRAFEQRLVREPALVRELEHSLRMREGLQQLHTQRYFEKAASRGGSLRVWVSTLAAAACAALALFLWLSRVSAPSPILMSAESRAGADVRPMVAAHFTFVPMRGSSAPDLKLPSAGLIEIRAAPSMRQTVHRFRVTLLRQNDRGVAEPVASLAALALGADGYVHCYADATRLSEGSYILRAQPDPDAPGMAEVFPFNLRAGFTGSSR